MSENISLFVDMHLKFAKSATMPRNFFQIFN
jgi:hypothetical protein